MQVRFIYAFSTNQSRLYVEITSSLSYGADARIKIVYIYASMSHECVLSNISTKCHLSKQKLLKFSVKSP